MTKTEATWHCGHRTFKHDFQAQALKQSNQKTVLYMRSLWLWLLW